MNYEAELNELEQYKGVKGAKYFCRVYSLRSELLINGSHDERTHELLWRIRRMLEKDRQEMKLWRGEGDDRRQVFALQTCQNKEFWRVWQSICMHSEEHERGQSECAGIVNISE